VHLSALPVAQRGVLGAAVRVASAGTRPHNGSPLRILDLEMEIALMKNKTHHRKSHKWRKRADSSPVAKCRRPKRQGRNPKKRRHLGGVGL
jgi:hypothetical protein